jgi:hypothetical protein
MIYLIGSTTHSESMYTERHVKDATDIPEMLAAILWETGPESQCRKVRVDIGHKLVHFEMKEIASDVWEAQTWHIFESKPC